MPAPRFVVTAVAGIVMATAVQVTATDLEHCMRVICENIRANALPLAAASSGAITAEELWWGDVPRTSCRDGFDYVIAADVVRRRAVVGIGWEDRPFVRLSTCSEEVG